MNEAGDRDEFNWHLPIYMIAAASILLLLLFLHIVRTVREAYAILGINAPEWQPLLTEPSISGSPDWCLSFLVLGQMIARVGLVVGGIHRLEYECCNRTAHKFS